MRDENTNFTLEIQTIIEENIGKSKYERHCDEFRFNRDDETIPK